MHMQLQLYRFYGSTRILEQTYNATLRWIEFLESQSHGKAVLHGVRACHGCLCVRCRLVCAANTLCTHTQLSDWMGLEPSPVELTGVLFLYGMRGPSTDDTSFVTHKRLRCVVHTGG